VVQLHLTRDIMKKDKFIYFSAFFFVILFCLTLGCTDLMGSDHGTISAEKLDEEPDDFINLTEEYRQKFPHLYQSINSSGELIKIPSDEYYELKDFFENSFTYIEYQGEYYYVRLFGIV